MFLTTADVEGKILNENKTMYLVDFSSGFKKFPKAELTDSYRKKLVEKSNCVKTNVLE